MVASEETGTRCRTCTKVRPVSDFYESATECVTCKKDRSKQTRLLAARKIALAERVIDMLTDMVSQGWRPDLCEHGAHLDRDPSTGPQEVHA